MFGVLVFVAACSSPGSGKATTKIVETNPVCMNGLRDATEAGVDCGGNCANGCDDGSTDGSNVNPQATPPSPTNAIKDGAETDVDCGGPDAPKCTEGKSCLADSDCDVACGYAKKCVGAPSCVTHLGGDTCGEFEVGDGQAQNESCCRTLPVKGFTDPAHPGKQVYLDKYEITAGRVRAFIDAMAAANQGEPNVRAWIDAHRPEIWDDAWSELVPNGWEGPTHVINRRLLGDPRPEDEGYTGPPGPGVILPPPTDEPRHFGANYQFNSEIYVDLHGNNCGAFDGSYGFSTYYYPPEILARDGQIARANGKDFSGNTIPAKDLLDVKSMNCITNAMLAAFCAWDGGQLATDEVLDYVTATPATLENVSGCGTQYDDHGELLNNKLDHTVQNGGRCAAVGVVNATFDAGDNLPVPNSPLNQHNYHFPDLGDVTHDKAWQVSAPGRASSAPNANGATDLIRLDASDEPWMDLAGNLNEAAFDMNGGTFTGAFAMKFRGIGYGSARSDMNVEPIKGEAVVRIQRPEAKAAYTGGRCMRFR